MNYTMMRPCDQCPFLDTAGNRYGFTLQRLREFARGEFHCHQTGDCDEETSDFIQTPKSLHCAGALIFNEQRKQPTLMMKINERFGFYDRTKLDYSRPVRKDKAPGKRKRPNARR